MAGYTISTHANRVEVFGDYIGLVQLEAVLKQARDEGSASIVADGRVVLSVVCEKNWHPR